MPVPGEQQRSPTDAELIAMVRAGDRRAYGPLYERHRRAALRVARHLARDEAAADDLRPADHLAGVPLAAGALADRAAAHADRHVAEANADAYTPAADAYDSPAAASVEHAGFVAVTDDLVI